MPVLGAAAGAAAPKLDIITLSLRGAAFSTQHEIGKPVTGPVRVALAAGLRQKALGDGRFEVVLDLRAEGISGTELLFAATVSQGGLLVVRDADGVDLAGLIREKGPELLYPYAREAMITTVDGSLFGGFTLGVTCPEVVAVSALA